MGQARRQWQGHVRGVCASHLNGGCTTIKLRAQEGLCVENSGRDTAKRAGRPRAHWERRPSTSSAAHVRTAQGDTAQVKRAICRPRLVRRRPRGSHQTQPVDQARAAEGALHLRWSGVGARGPEPDEKLASSKTIACSLVLHHLHRRRIGPTWTRARDRDLAASPLVLAMLGSCWRFRARRHGYPRCTQTPQPTPRASAGRRGCSSPSFDHQNPTNAGNKSHSWSSGAAPRKKLPEVDNGGDAEARYAGPPPHH